MSKSSIGRCAIPAGLLIALGLIAPGHAAAQHSGAGSSIGGFGASPTYAGGNTAGIPTGATFGAGVGGPGMIATGFNNPNVGVGSVGVGAGTAYPSSVGDLFGYPGVGNYTYPQPTNLHFNGFGVPFVYAGYSNPFGYGNGYVGPGPTYTGYVGGMDSSMSGMGMSTPDGFPGDGSSAQSQQPRTRPSRRSGARAAGHRDNLAPSAPLDQLVAEDGKVLWPGDTPKVPELAEKLQAAERAIDAVVRDFRGQGRASIRGIAIARRKLSDLAGPALKRLKADRPDDAETFAQFVKDLDRNLRVMSAPTPSTTTRRAGASLGVNPDGTSKIDEMPTATARPGTAPLSQPAANPP